MGADEQIMPYISLANLACGFHASDAVTMNRSVELAKKYNVTIGAHPSLSRFSRFGRRSISLLFRRDKIKIANYQKIFTLADNLDKMFPSLDYLLSHLSQLPWDTLEYKDLRFSFFDISASFSDADVTKMIRSYSNKLKI